MAQFLEMYFFTRTFVLCTDVSWSWPVDEKSLGQSKAKCVSSFLQELNDAVKAKFVEESPETLIESTPSFFSQFTLVIATQVCYNISYWQMFLVCSFGHKLNNLNLDAPIGINRFLLNSYAVKI